MGVGIAVYLLLISIIGYALSDPAAPDCRKFVFAPLCRGVAAKRSHLQQMPKKYTIDANNIKAILKSFNLESRNNWPNDMSRDNDGSRLNERAKIQEQIDVGVDFSPEYD